MRKSLPTVPLILRRQVHRNAELLENCVEAVNRNPRNLELLRIARKPAGYHLDRAGREFWHKLIVEKGRRFISAKIIHHENGSVISASTEEWGLKKQLYRPTDTSTYINVGRVLALRCLESGIYEVYCNLEAERSEKLNLLLQEVEKNGVTLRELGRYLHPYVGDKYRPEKPWEVVE